MKKFGFVMLILCGFVSAAFGGGRRDRNIVIGGILSLSGSYRVLGTEVQNGINLALAEINNNGGINGRQLVIQIQDDGGSPQQAVNVFNQMVRQKVKIIIGSNTSACTAALSPLAQAKKILLLTPSATGENVLDGGNFSFRTCYTDFDQGNAAGVYAADPEGLGLTKAALIRTGSNAGVTLMAETFSASFKALGGSIVADEVYGAGDINFNDLALRVKTGSPEIIFVPEANYAIAVQVLNAIKAQGIRGAVIGLDAWEGIVLEKGIEMERRHPNTYYFPAHFAPDSLNPLAADFVSSYELSYGSIPLSFAALGYDSAYLIRDAMRNTKKPDNPVVVRDAMVQINGEYVTGRISFAGTRDPKKPRMILQITRSGEALQTILAYNIPQ
jgi:branched-chain amino acid transport system substrate-binding protein